MSQQSKFFPGWLVVAAGFVIMATVVTANISPGATRDRF